jgi:hypothetical protein
LIHTTVGDLLRRIQCPDLKPDPETGALPPITNILFNRDCFITIFYGHNCISTMTTSGSQLSKPVFIQNERILCATLSRDGEHVVFGTDNGSIFVFKLFPIQKLYTFPVILEIGKHT